MFTKAFFVIFIIILLLLFFIFIIFHRKFNFKEHFTDNVKVGEIFDDCNVLLSNNFYHASNQEVPKCKYITPLVTKENNHGVNGILFADTTSQNPKRHSGWALGKSLDWLIQSVNPKGSVYIQPNGGKVRIGKSDINNDNNNLDSFDTIISGGLYVNGKSNKSNNALHVDKNAFLKNANIGGNITALNELQTNNLNVLKNTKINGDITVSGSLYANGFDLTNQRVINGDLELNKGKIVFGNKVILQSENHNNNLAVHLGDDKNASFKIYKNKNNLAHSFNKEGTAFHANSLCIGNTCLSADDIRRLKEKINLPCIIIKRKRRRRRFF